MKKKNFLKSILTLGIILTILTANHMYPAVKIPTPAPTIQPLMIDEPSDAYC